MYNSFCRRERGEGERRKSLRYSKVGTDYGGWCRAEPQSGQDFWCQPPYISTLLLIE